MTEKKPNIVFAILCEFAWPAAAFLALVALVWALVGCAPTCRSLSWRCSDNAVQLCRPDGRWATVARCAEVKRDEGACVCACSPSGRCGCTVEVPK